MYKEHNSLLKRPYLFHGKIALTSMLLSDLEIKMNTDIKYYIKYERQCFIRFPNTENDA